jgi:hypothetical protein
VQVPVTVVPPAAAKAKPAPRPAITPAIRRQIEDSLASAPGIEQAVVTQQVESSKGLETVSAREDGLPEIDDIAEQTDKARKQNTRLPAQPKKISTKQPAYLKSVAHPVVQSADPEAPWGRDENNRPILLGRSDQALASDLLSKKFLGPGTCPHKHNPEYCIQCKTNYKTATEQTATDQTCRAGLELIEEALRRKRVMKSPVIETDTFDYFPEILEITRRQLIGLFDLPVGVEPRAVERKILKSTLAIESRIAEIKQVPRQIEKRKQLIARSEECIRSWSAHIMKIQVKRGERAPGDIPDKRDREAWKRKEQTRISRCKQVIMDLRKRESHLDGLQQRLATWGERPEDHEIVALDEDVVVTFEDKFKLSKRYLEEHAEDRPKDSITNHFDIFPEYNIINKYLAMLSEFDILKDESRRIHGYQEIDRWRYLENEIIFQAIRWGLVRPTEQTIKKYPWLDQSTSGRPEQYENDFEGILIIKTGGSAIGASIYSAGTTWDGRHRQLSTFDRPVTNGNKSDSGASAPPGEFYSEIDSGDFGEDK